MTVISDLRAQYPNLAGVTDEDIIGYTAAQNGIKAGTPQYDALRSAMGGYDRTWGQTAGDVAVGAGKGVAALGMAAGELGGALLPGVSAFDNPVVNASRSLSSWLDTKRSAGSLNQQAAADQEMRLAQAQAKASGQDVIQTATTELTTFLKSLVDHPAVATDVAAQQIPQLGAGKLLGLGGKAAGTFAGLGEAGAARAGTGAVVAGMAGQQGGQAGQMAYDELVKRGVPPDEAARQAGIVAAQAAPVSAGLMLLPGARNLPKALAGEPIVATGSRLGLVARTAAAEAGAQGADQAFTQFAANRAVNAVDPSFDVGSGLGAAFGVGGAMGLVTGGFGGAMVPRHPRTAGGEIDLTKPPEAPTDSSRPPEGPTADGGFVVNMTAQPRGLQLPPDVNIPAARRKEQQVFGPQQPGPDSSTSLVDLAGPVVNPVQTHPASFVDLVEPQPGLPPNPFDTSGFPSRPPAALLPFNPTMFGEPGGAVNVGVMPSEQDVAQRKYPILPSTPSDGSGTGTGPGPGAGGGGGTPVAPVAPVAPIQSSAPGITVTFPPGFDPNAPAPAAPAAPTAPATPAGRPTNGELLQAIAAEKRAYVKKNGELANNAGGNAMRSILESPDPMGTIRGMYQDGAGARDEMLDNLHKRFTGQTVDEFNAAQKNAAPVNSAGFVPEPASDIQSQLDAVREGRKDSVVLGKGEDVGQNVTGLVRSTVRDPKTKDTATVFTLPKNKKLPARAQVRAAKVGLKQALGEMQGVANPEATTRPQQAPVAVVEQRDDATGAVVSSEVVTPQDLPNVKPVPGTTAEVVPVQEAMTRRLAGGDAQAALAATPEINTVNSEPAAPAKSEPVAKSKAPRLGRTPVDKVVDLANTTKDETTFNAAEDELYRRWVDFGDDKAENYFLADARPAKNQSAAVAFSESTHGQELQARYEAARDAKGVQSGQELGKKFGASLRESTADIYDGIQTREGTTARQRATGRAAIGDLERLVSEPGTEGIPGRDSNGQRAAPPAEAAPQRAADTGRQPTGAGPDATRTGQAGGRGIIPRRLADQVQLLGQRLIAGFKAGRNNQLVGQTVRSAADVAALAQVYRDPRFETMRVLYLDENGKILGETALTSRLPGAVAADPTGLGDVIVAGMDRVGARQWVLIHNHPTGDPTPSPEDRTLTRTLNASVPGFVGHVVIDHNQYATLNHRGEGGVTDAPQLEGVDFTATPSTPHPALGREIHTTEDVARIAKDLEVPQGKGQLVLLDSAGRVQQITQIPLSLLEDGSKVGAIKNAALIRRLTRMAGAGGSRILVVPDGSRLTAGTKALIDANVLSVAMDASGRGLPATPGASNPFIEEALVKSAQTPTQARLLRESTEALKTHPAMEGFGRAAHAVRDAVRAKSHEVSPTLLSALTFNQIAEHYSKFLPAMSEVKDAIFERAARADQMSSTADRVARRWARAVRDAKTEKAFNEILLGASEAEISLDNVDPRYLASLTADQRAEHTRLRARLATMPPELQAVRREALGILHDQWAYTHDALARLIEHLLPDPAARRLRLRELDKDMGHVKGDYFPLARFGNRVVVGRGAAKDGRDVVTFHETAASAEREVRRLKAEGVKNIAVNLLTERDPRQRASTGFMGGLHTMIESAEDVPADVKEQMHQDLQQLYLKSLPELSGAKHMIRRDKVEGYSQDALRGFADSVTRGAHYATNLDYAPRIQAGMESAEVQSRSSDKRSAALIIARKGEAAPVIEVTAPGTARYEAVSRLMDEGYDVRFFNGTIPETVREHLAGHAPELTDAQVEGVVKRVEDQIGRNSEGVEDMRAAKALYNHLVKLQRAEIHHDGPADKVVDTLGQVGYVWYLGFTPAFWTMNLMQNPMIGIPHLGGRYGLAKSVAAMGEAARWFATVRIGKLLAHASEPFSIEWLRKQNPKGISKGQLDMLQFLQDNRGLDFTQARDLGRIASDSNNTWTKAMRLAAAGAHHTEVFNRVVYALAEYNLAMRSSPTMTHEKARQRALEGVRTVHFDYTPENKPLAMRGTFMRLPMMFQQYRQHMLHWWGNSVIDATAGESPEVKRAARKSALLMGLTHAIFAGALGLPFVGTAGFIANIFGEDDEDGTKFNFDRWVTDAARGITGSDKAAEIVTKGIFTALNMNIGQRIGQANLLPFLNEQAWQYGNSAQDKLRNVLVDLLGPLGSIAINAAGSTTAFARGDTLGGLAAVTPKAISDVLKAMSLYQQGLVDNKGEPIALAEAFDGSDIFMQAAGVSPASVARLKQDRSAVRDIEQSIKDRTGQLRNRFVEAWSRNDTQGMQEVMADITDYNKKIASGRLRAVPGAIIDGRSLASAVRARQQQALIRVLTHGTADTKRQMLLALSMSGLLNPASLQSAESSLPGLPGLSQ